MGLSLPERLRYLIYPKGRQVLGQKDVVPWLIAGILTILILLINGLGKVACFEVDSFAKLPGKEDLFCLTSAEDSIRFFTNKAFQYIGAEDVDEILDLTQTVNRIPDLEELKFSHYYRPLRDSIFNKAKVHYDQGNYFNTIQILEEVLFKFEDFELSTDSVLGHANQMLGICYFYESNRLRSRGAVTRLNSNPAYLEQVVVPNLSHMLAYDFVDAMYNGRVRVRRDGYYGFLDENGLPTWRTKDGQLPYLYAYNYLSDGTALVAENGSLCPIDRNGEFLIDRCFVELKPYKDELSGLYGYQNEMKVELIQPQYEMALPFSSAQLALVRSKAGKYGFIQKNGQVVVPIIYDDANSFSQGLANARMKDKWGYLNTSGEVVIPFRFDSAVPFDEDGIAQVELNGGEFSINLAGKCVDGACPQAEFLVRILDSNSEKALANVTASHSILGNFNTDQAGVFRIALPENRLPQIVRFQVRLDGYETKIVPLEFNFAERDLTIFLQKQRGATNDKSE